ncbi:MAG: polynucleotide kinase-phosphatase [Myxococcota bacterium]
MRLSIPELSLVLLAGPTGSGKSTFARRHFAPTEILSSDTCRGLVADDENDQSATPDAFDVLYYIAGKRLAARRLAVVDATNVRKEDRQRLVALAREHDVLPVIIVLDVDPDTCHARNEARDNRDFGPRVPREHSRLLRRSLKSLKREGFRQITVLKDLEAIDAVHIERARLWCDRREDKGPFDIIGDIHGCFDELVTLLGELGYAVDADPSDPSAVPPPGRKTIFLGDLVDRGPKSPAVLRLAMRMVQDGHALAVPGNHDVKLLRKLRGHQVRIAHGLAETLEQLEHEPETFKEEVMTFIDSLVSHLLLDDGQLVVAHAGMKAALQGRASKRVREFALYGETTGETDGFGLPERYDWAQDYRGRATVVYGHTPTRELTWVNGTLCLDTGCVFGGHLSALRYPERTVVQVPARSAYAESLGAVRFDEAPRPSPAPRPGHGLLDLEDVTGKRVVRTRLDRTVTVHAENAAAALEVMSRFALDPRWLIYLPPTMSPSTASASGEYLEHPRESFAYFRENGVGRVMCQEKHMGSRAILVVLREDDVAVRRFGFEAPGSGAIYSRTGRAFFRDDTYTLELLRQVREALTRAELWDRLETDWVALDVEILPWSAKAQSLLTEQYAPTGASGLSTLTEAEALLSNTPAAASLRSRLAERRACVEAYLEAYRRYCWAVASPADLEIAPFHVLAGERGVYLGESHAWHMERLDRLCAAAPQLLRRTAQRTVDVTSPDQEEEAVRWWMELTARGGEGMVVKPLDGMVKGPKGWVQPALKCRGREYLRIIYGPEYTLPDQLERLRARGVGRKRSLALRETALGWEGLHRFVAQEPLFRVHECTFGVLALESEPVDPRL